MKKDFKDSIFNTLNKETSTPQKQIYDKDRISLIKSSNLFLLVKYIN